MAQAPKYLKVEVPLSVVWRVRQTRLLERTASTYRFSLKTSRALLLLAWIELAWKILLIAAKTIYEPLGDGNTYSIIVKG